MGNEKNKKKNRRNWRKEIAKNMNKILKNKQILLGTDCNKENVPDVDLCPMPIPTELMDASSSKHTYEPDLTTLQTVELKPIPTELTDACSSKNTNEPDFMTLQTEELLPETGYLQNYSDDHTAWYEITRERETESICPMNGRRLIDLKHFFKSLQTIGSHNEAFGCTLSNVQIIGEKRKGLLSKYTLKCNMCNVKFILDSEPKSNLDLNKAATSGIISTGIGVSQFNELFASMDCPSFTQKH